MQLSKISSGGSGVKSCSVAVAGSKVLRSQIYSADRRARGVLALRSLSRSLRGQASLGSASGRGPAADGRTVLPTIDSVSLSQRLRCPGRVSQDAGIPRAARTALPVRRGRGASFSHALRGGRHGSSRMFDQCDQRFLGDLGLAQARLNELLALVQLHEALGGGWQQ